MATTIRWPLFLNDLKNDKLLFEHLTDKSGVRTDQSIYWETCRQLVDLIRFYPSEEDRLNYLMDQFDVEKLTQISPLVVNFQARDANIPRDSDGESDESSSSTGNSSSTGKPGSTSDSDYFDSDKTGSGVMN